MKKNNNLLKFTLLLSLLILGCDKDFLDEPKPTGEVSSNVIFESKEGAESHISGILRRFRGQYRDTETGGVYSLYYARTVKGNDIIQRPTWYLFDYDNDNREPGYRRTSFTWDYCFYQINQTNIFLKGINESESISEIDKKNLEAQATTIRAFFYFQLIMEFQHTYAYDTSLPGVPIYTEPTSKGNPMSTVKEVYDLIIKDLTTANQNISTDRIGKSYINKNVVNGLLARVYLVMGNWSEAATAAKAAQSGYSLDPSSYNMGFADINNIEWIWGMPQSSDQTAYYYTAPHAFADHNANSYFGTYINEDFVAQFSNSDVRNLFENKNRPPGDYRSYTTTKFTFKFESDMVLMRLPEMLLIESEAKARLGDENSAAEILFGLQKNRDPNAIRANNSGTDLIEEILLERRKELYAEIGVEWFDAKRLRRGITRTGNHRIMKNLSPDDNRFFLKIPQTEIDANENIDETVNSNR